MAALTLPMPSAVLLDLDGTLVDSEPAHRAAWYALFKAHGWHVDDDTYLSNFVGRRGTDVLSTLRGPWEPRNAEALTAEAIGYLPRFLDRATRTTGAVDLLHELRAQSIPTAVVTSASREWVRHVLDRVLEAQHLVTTIVTAEDVKEGKPHPAGYLLACARLSVPPSEAVAFEDAPAGIQAAVSAGVRTVVGVRSSYAEDALRAAGASYVVASLADVSLVTER